MSRCRELGVGRAGRGQSEQRPFGLGDCLRGARRPARRLRDDNPAAAGTPVAGIERDRRLNIGDARYYGDTDAERLSALATQAFNRSKAAGLLNANGEPPTRTFLAISGGGDDGAYGAGFLVGWSARGDRPEFGVVTGVSTGALSAPFVFLGSEYDEQLKRVYTETDAGDVFEKRGLMAAVAEDAMTDSAPLRNRIGGFVDKHMVQRLAEEYGKGRLLMILTTNLDQGRPVIWNIGAIAASGHPRSRELIVDVLLASAALPGLFPPVMIGVTIDGKDYQEMHVDGGAVAQAFLYPPSFNLRAKIKELGIKNAKPVAYIIRNAAPLPARGERRAADLEDRPAGDLDDDGIERRQRPLPHVPDDEARRRSLQPRLHRRGLPAALQGPVRQDLHERALRLRLQGGARRLQMAQDSARLCRVTALAGPAAAGRM